MIPQLIPVLSGGPDAYLDFDFRFGQERYWLNRQRYGEFGLVPGASSSGGNNLGQALRNGSWSGNLPDGTPLIGGGGLSGPEARTNLWIPSDGVDPASTWNIGAACDVLPGTIPSIINGAKPVLFVATGVSGRRQKNTTIPNDTLTRTFTVWVEKKNASVNVYTQHTAGGTTVSSLIALNCLTGTFSGSGIVTDQGLYWRVDVSSTNNASGNTVCLGSVQTIGALPQSINVLNPIISAGAAIIDPPIVTTGLAATRTAVAQSVSGLVLPPAGAIYEEYIQPIIQTTTRTYVWNILDGGSARFTRRASFGSGSSNTDFVTGDGSGATTTLSRSAPAAGTLVRSLCAYDTTTARAAFAFNGVDTFEARQSTAATLSNATLQIGQGGAGGQINSDLRRLVILPRFPDAAERIAITTGGL